ncbi:hypothetical protein JG687_00002176 [Phytophthora cactorum]|uniref:DOT1 domain-containing protein n=2 Tax=Phytophthora cactorum TaxID=29920 RepID=A0A8T1CYM4_9STRA|nr:hypothetical protein PC115_g6122 [Phytophthora cactorum]KAG4245415.1 hypothetical protein PC116_g6770 [Phytophthora cactorum]KAG6971229.1 hypothetical protein JG687_00002176 [Phytophthora cactorum]
METKIRKNVSVTVGGVIKLQALFRGNKSRRVHVERARNNLPWSPFVPAKLEAVYAILEVADLHPGETLVDIGSGDGRVVIEAAVQCPELKKARGLELDEALVGLSRRRVIERAEKEEDESIERPEQELRREKGTETATALRERVEIVHADFMEVDMKDTDVVVLFFLPHKEISRTLQEKLRPGTRVVTYIGSYANEMDVGYGICGHKNSFSTGVKLGNYVEDRIGADLARNSSSKPINKHSEYSSSFIQPREMPDKCAHAPAENLVERNMIRQGLSYDLIFEHGRPHIPTATEQAAKFTLTSHDYGMKSGIPSNESDRRMKQEMKRSREAREQRNAYLSTSQAIVPAHTGSKR